MKLKTRVKLAYAEMALATAALIGALAADLALPQGRFGFAGLGIGALLGVLIMGPVCLSAWKRLLRTRAQLAELGPDGVAAADPLWTSPRISGALGILILVAALAFAVSPVLLLA